MKKLILLPLLLTLVACEPDVIVKTTGIVESVENCGRVKDSTVHMNDNRVFRLNNMKCELLKPGAEIKFEYTNNLYMKNIKYVEKGEN